jgi:hypothetical protein
MTTKTKSISRYLVVALGALLVGLPATRALAAEPTTVSEAQAVAQQYREQADHYRALGGVGYKSGLVQRADADAAKYSALAERLSAPPAATLPRSPEAEHYAQLAQQYRAMGGSAYKSGMVQWAEARQRKYEAVSGPTPATSHTPARTCSLAATKPSIRVLACAR